MSLQIKRQECKKCGEYYDYILEVGNDGYCSTCTPNKNKVRKFKIIVRGEEEE